MRSMRPINDVISSACEHKLYRNLLNAIIIQHSHTFIISYRPIFGTVNSSDEKSAPQRLARSLAQKAINNSRTLSECIHIQRQHIKIIKISFPHTRNRKIYGHTYSILAMARGRRNTLSPSHTMASKRWIKKQQQHRTQFIKLKL